MSNNPEAWLIYTMPAHYPGTARGKIQCVVIGTEDEASAKCDELEGDGLLAWSRGPYSCVLSAAELAELITA